MADWVNIIDSALDPDAPLTSELAYAWRDNPIAIAEGSNGAPYVRGEWHPFNGVSYGDGRGVIYDSSVDGQVSAVVTPTFESGYDYCISLDGVGTTVSDQLLRLSSTRVGGSGFVDPFTIGTGTSGIRVTGFVIIGNPRVSSYSKIFHGISNASDGSATRRGYSANGGVAYFNSMISWTSTEINAGRIFLYRRIAKGGISY